MNQKPKAFLQFGNKNTNITINGVWWYKSFQGGYSNQHDEVTKEIKVIFKWSVES